MIHTLDFQPLPLISSRHLQTILGNYGWPGSPPPTEDLIVDLPDGDRLCYGVSTPDEWNQETIVLIHGLTSSHNAEYMIRISQRLYSLGYKVVRINQRGCGCGSDLARKPTYGGASHDILAVLKQLPRVPTQVVGFSLGGNILLKLLGELGDDAEQYLQGAIAVCPPVHLESTVERIRSPQCRLYQKYFMKFLIQKVRNKEKAFPDSKRVVFPKKNLSLYEFDDIYISQQWGFKNAHDYYTQCSSGQFVPKIKIPCKILYAQDDPMIDPKTIDAVETPECVQLYRTQYGGHMGFLGFAKGYGVRWMDYQVIEWLTKKAATWGGLRPRRDLG